jgi:hypothetical protein
VAVRLITEELHRDFHQPTKMSLPGVGIQPGTVFEVGFYLREEFVYETSLCSLLLRFLQARVHIELAVVF